MSLPFIFFFLDGVGNVSGPLRPSGLASGACCEGTVNRRRWSHGQSADDDDLVRRIQTWALEEARRRLEAEGILEDPENKK